MRLRVEALELAGTTRRLDLQPGLNVISGPITTGKTTALRLIRVLLGSGASGLPAEVRARVSGLAGSVVVGDDTFSIFRPLATSNNAYIEIAGAGETWRLPPVTPDHVSRDTYGDWLLRRLGLPQIDVPSAPTRPDSAPTPVTIRDWMNYCVLTDADIDSAVFGHDDPYRNIKRRYVFQILYGIYDIAAAALQERYRALSAERQLLTRSSEALTQVLRDTPWANRAQLFQELADAEQLVADRRNAEVEAAETAVVSGGSQQLRGQVLDIDREIESITRDLVREDGAVADMTRLARQLETQSARLTRAIVAETRLLDFEFVVCPRCGSSVGAERDAENVCRLCLQPPSRIDDRAHLVEEQNRIGQQLAETDDLIQRHEDAAATLRLRLSEGAMRRREIGLQLEQRARAYVSDAASNIADQASDRVRAEETLRRLRDYALLFERQDEAAAERGELDEELESIEQQLARLTVRDDPAERRIQILEGHFARILERFGVPRFADPPTAQIDRRTFLPHVDGRTFDTASQGMKVLINVAHALAHQLTSIDEDLPLPNLLIIDALSSNIGHGGYDEAVRERVYGFLAEVSEEHAGRLQLIVADNDVPRDAERYVRMELSPTDMLVPA